MRGRTGELLTASGASTRIVALDHLAVERGVDVRGGLDRLDHPSGSAALTESPGLRQLEVRDVAQLGLRVVRDPER
jgi:hypothetical protein